MATAAFRSTSRRSSIGGGGGPEDAGSSNRYRRSRSLSRCSGRFPPHLSEPEEFTIPRGRFVNKVRGSGFPDISLDDLAAEFFRERSEEAEEEISASTGRTGRRLLGERLMADTESSRRRGGSVSSHRGDSSVALGNGVSENRGISRPRRSVSVARSRGGEMEGMTRSTRGSFRIPNITSLLYSGLATANMCLYAGL